MQIYCIMLQFTNTHMSFPSIPFLTAYKWFPLCERSELYFISVDWNPGRFDNNCKKSDKIVKNLKNYITPSNFQSHLYKCKKSSLRSLKYKKIVNLLALDLSVLRQTNGIRCRIHDDSILRQNSEDWLRGGKASMCEEKPESRGWWHPT